MRKLRLPKFSTLRCRLLCVFLIGLYLIAFVVIPNLLYPVNILPNQTAESSFPTGHVNQQNPVVRDAQIRRHGEKGNASIEQSKFTYKIKKKGKVLTIESVLIAPGTASLKERVTLVPKKKRSILLMWDVGFTQENIRGCPDWNCEVTQNRRLLAKADAVFIQAPVRDISRRPGQLFVHYSQESPVNSFNMNPRNTPKGYYNMSLGFRMDTAAASPYGYAAKLAPESRLPESYLDEIEKKFFPIKRKAIAWLVSHCSTNSQREVIIRELQNFMPVDVYGSCGPLSCPKNRDCKEMINQDYYFYFAAENSNCKDYTTEKVWNSGYDNMLVPIVLRRKLIENYVPPNSFIAVDDYPNLKQMADHLSKLMANPKEYRKYFEWRLEYVTVILDGNTDPTAERAFGFCQVCRITQMSPLPKTIIEDMEKWWTNSCESDGALVRELGIGKDKSSRI